MARSRQVTLSATTYLWGQPVTYVMLLQVSSRPSSVHEQEQVIQDFQVTG